MNHKKMLQEMLDNNIKYIKIPATIINNEVKKFVFPFDELMYQEENEYEWEFVERGYKFFEERYKLKNEAIDLLKNLYAFSQGGNEMYSELKSELENFIKKYCPEVFEEK